MAASFFLQKLNTWLLNTNLEKLNLYKTVKEWKSTQVATILKT